MRTNKEISALLHLVDDPDKEVFETVAQKILGYGSAIIPNLEQLWETTIDESVQYRIEVLIHRALFKELQEAFAKWAKDPAASLLSGAILVARYRFPDLDKAAVYSQFDQIKRNVWLEMNYYLTPLEQINVLNSILYNFYKLKGQDITNRNSNLFFINHMLESKMGNAFTIGIVYLSLCEALDIPIFAVGLPRQFVLAYFDSLYHFLSPNHDPVLTVQFYVDPINGLVYTQNDVDVYLKKINAPGNVNYLRPLGAKEVIRKMLEELALTYEYEGETDKALEMQQLLDILTAETAES